MSDSDTVLHSDRGSAPPETGRQDAPSAAVAAVFESILWPDPGGGDRSPREAGGSPDCFRDLNLDQIVATITAKWPDYNLAPFFWAPNHDPATIVYRQEVMRDLEQPAVQQVIATFSHLMQSMRACLARAQKSYYPEERERRFLDAVAAYVEGVQRLSDELDDLVLASRGMRTLRDYVASYVTSDQFERLRAQTARLLNDLSAIRYTLLIRGRSVTVRSYEGEADYTLEVDQTFAKFRRGTAKDYLVTFRGEMGLNHVEAQILQGVAALNPDVFGAVTTFYVAHQFFQDAKISRFEREVHFYIAFLDYLEPLKRAGLPFCYPQLSQRAGGVCVHEAFDLALAARLAEQREKVVRNGFYLRGRERILVVTGPNHGGKTTFARMFGQLHYLASLGCLVPGADARLLACDRLLTHFEREEDITTLQGKLRDDLVRIRWILSQSTPQTVVILNEIFSSTTSQDALYLSRKIMAQMSGLDLLCVWVTFLTDLASFDEKTVSMVGGVDSNDPTVPTYKIERRPPDGLAHALAIAEKHRVTERDVKDRIPA